MPQMRCLSDTLRHFLVYLEKFQTQLFLDVFHSDLYHNVCYQYPALSYTTVQKYGVNY